MLLKGYYEYYFLLLANTQPFPENHRKCVYVSDHTFSPFLCCYTTPNCVSVRDDFVCT